jgi:tetratricopeptide (TPR) repeat protein
MKFQTSCILISFLLFSSMVSTAQEAAAIDSLKAAIAKASSVEEKIDLTDELSKVVMNVSPKDAEQYGQKLIAIAEESRNRKLMFKAYLSNGDRCSYMANQKAYSDRAIEFMNKALTLARENKMEEEVGAAQLHLTAVYLMIPDNDKALSNVTQAFSLLSTLNNDSLKAEAHNAYGEVYLARNEKILALRNFFSGLRIAEEIKNQTVIKNCYLYLADFYAKIDDNDKAIDYLNMAYHQLDKLTGKNIPYQRVVLLNSIGNRYAAKKNYEIAISYYNSSIKKADSLKFSTLKIPGYISLLNQYLEKNEPQNALEYLNSPSGVEMKKFIGNFGMASMIDMAYGITYRELGRFDSARYYFEKAKPDFETSNNENNKVNFYRHLAVFYKKSGDKKNAIDYFLKVKEIAERNDQLEYVKAAAKNLDSLYAASGNLQQSGVYKGIYYQYKDSIEVLNKEKELVQVEAGDELQRQTRLEKEKEESKKRRNNIQYIGIVIGIITLFVSLVLLGMFKVSAGLLKAIGFFVFLMLFEFIFLVFKKNIYSITHGEPWKDLAFMIALAALLVPLHHWLEHKVLHYLTSHNRLTSAGLHIKNKLFRRIKKEQH